MAKTRRAGFGKRRRGGRKTKRCRGGRRRSRVKRRGGRKRSRVSHRVSKHRRGGNGTCPIPGVSYCPKRTARYLRGTFCVDDGDCQNGSCVAQGGGNYGRNPQRKVCN